MRRDIIVIGASAGGVEAIKELTSLLPADLPAALFVVLHIAPQSTSVLPLIVSRHSALPARHPGDEEDILPGNIYIAPPDHHLIIKPGKALTTRGPKENRNRPSVDPLFRSAARAYGNRVIGVILSGTLDDGTAGLYMVKQHGGLAIVQDPATALYSAMPRSAITNVEVDYALPIPEIAAVLIEQAGEPVKEEGNPDMADQSLLETETAQFNGETISDADIPGVPSAYSCPDCHGTLWEVREGELVRFRCRVGHAFSVESLLAAQSDAVEEAMWTAYRALKESAALARRMAQRAVHQKLPRVARQLQEQCDDAESRAKLIEEVLRGGEIIKPEPMEAKVVP